MPIETKMETIGRAGPRSPFGSQVFALVKWRRIRDSNS